MGRFKIKQGDGSFKKVAWKDEVDNLAGSGRTVETVKGNADKIGDLTTMPTIEKSNLAGAVGEVKNEVTTLKEEYTQYKDNNNLKIAKVEKDINDYQATIATMNPNQEVKQKVTGYGTVSLPKNAANGQVSTSVKGITRTNLIDKTNITTTHIVNYTLEQIEKGIKITRNNAFVTGMPTTPELNLKPNTTYIISAKKGNTNSSALDIDIYLDGAYSTKFNLLTVSSKIFTTSSSGKTSFKFNLDANSYGEFLEILLEEGTEIKNYINDTKSTVCAMRLKSVNEGETEETIQYIIGKDQGTGEILELRSLPNGTKDEINIGEKKAIIRTKKYIIQAEDITLDSTTYTYVDMYRIQTPNDIATLVNNIVVTFLEGSNYVRWNNKDSLEQVGNHTYNIGSQRIWYIAEKGLTLEQVRERLTGKTLIYQLAEPIITPIEVSGNLVSYPSGTVYVEKVVADAGIYNNGITTQYTTLPIKSVDKLIKYNFATGVQTELDASKTVVNANKLSFTHPELANGDMVFFDYYYDLESTEAETEIEYLDSRHTIKDTTNGKHYSWKITSTNGVASVSLTEV